MKYCSTIDCIMSSSWIIHFIWHTSSQNSKSGTRHLYFIYDCKIKISQGGFHLRWMSDGRGCPKTASLGRGRQWSCQSLLKMNDDCKSTPSTSPSTYFLTFNILETKRLGLYYKRLKKAVVLIHGWFYFQRDIRQCPATFLVIITWDGWGYWHLVARHQRCC